MNMREDLKAFIDNELSDSERTEILRDVEGNPDLQAEIIELRQISRVVREEAWQPEPVGLEATLRALSAGGSAPKPWWMRTPFQFALGTACTLVLVAVLFPVFAQPKSALQRDAAIAAFREASMESSGGFGGPAPAASPSRQIPASDIGPAEAESKSLPMAGAIGGNEIMEDSRVSPSATNAPTAVPRLEIKTGYLSVEVEDVAKAQSAAESIARAVGGRIESSSKNANEGMFASADLTIRVPVANFQDAVNRLRELGRVVSDNLSGQDVTTQVVDVEARLKVLRAEEDQYIELLKETKKIGEVLSVKERLSQVRQEVESLDATRKALRSQAAESTIQLSLREKPKPDRPKQNEEWAEDAWSRAVSGLSSAGRALGSAAVFLFVFSPIWLPIVLVGWWLVRRSTR